MAIPDYQSLMLPLLKVAADGKVHTKRDAVNELAQRFKLTDEELKEPLPSGNQGCLITVATILLSRLTPTI